MARIPQISVSKTPECLLLGFQFLILMSVGMKEQYVISVTFSQLRVSLEPVTSQLRVSYESVTSQLRVSYESVMSQLRVSYESVRSQWRVSDESAVNLTEIGCFSIVLTLHHVLVLFTARGVDFFEVVCFIFDFVGLLLTFNDVDFFGSVAAGLLLVGVRFSLKYGNKAPLKSW